MTPPPPTRKKTKSDRGAARSGRCVALRGCIEPRCLAAANPNDLRNKRREEAVKICEVLRVGLQIALIVALGIACAVPAMAQDKKTEAQLRTIHGSVLDQSETPVPSSVVYLLNAKSQAVKTYIADETGSYRFSGLDPNSDYEIHAEHQDLQSSTRTVSSYDSRRDVEIILKLNHKKTEH
jgi:hypothetical protein